MSAPVRTESNGPLVTGVAVGFLSAAVVFMALRFYTRGAILKNIGKDDWTILVALVFSLVNSIAMCFEVKYGMGRHIENVSMEEGLEQLKYLMVAILTYNMGMNVVKLGFLFQYRRIFRDKLIQRICLSAIAVVCLWACTQAALLSLACLPIGVIIPTMATSCLNTLPIWYFSSSMSMATDIAILCIPLPSVWKLQLPWRQFVIVVGIFCLGFFVCIISVYRMFTLRAGVISEDPSWDNIGAAMWSCIELNVAIIASSLPTLRPLFAHLLPGLGLSSAGRATYLRYGSATAGGGRSGTRSFATRPKKTMQKSISNEELTLDNMTPTPSESERGRGPRNYAAHATADHSGGQFPHDSKDEGRIFMKTEISVNTGSRGVSRK
ncbi:hypothetical protein B0T18DRAFT_428258 [Schizothecium vesticola]|uniref:Rhodopsin domain-containing protein n=1 Tax=Schizothecium vesticola TaxID=314040 RepID=A0AA40F3F0_9PEZI|nr:hypothetical protein B0T18DRAFT_428258 [Schizothecium vesticola]